MVPSAFMGRYKATSRSAVRARCILSVSSANRKLGVGGEAAGQLPDAPSLSQNLGLPLRIRRKAQGENAGAISSNPV